MTGIFRLTMVVFSLFYLCHSINPPNGEEIFERIEIANKVSYRDFVKTAQVFRSTDLIDFRPMIVDDKRRQILVGVRNAILRLNSGDLLLIEKIDWSPTQKTRDLCQKKGQMPSECHNFIRTMLIIGDRLFICGTNAFAPLCTWRKMSDLNTRTNNDESGVGTAPFGPTYSYAYTVTADTTAVGGGRPLVGVTTDTGGHDPAWLRIGDRGDYLRTRGANERWMNDPQFVHASNRENFVHLFFNEKPIELQSCKIPLTPRLARVCKNDIGGDIILQKTWTTFNKATLNCQLDGIDYSKLEAVFDWEKSGRNLLFAVFSVEKSHLFSSAICIYDSESITSAFSGPFLDQASLNDPWISHTNNYGYFDCETYGINSSRPGITKKTLVDAQQYQLMARKIQPTKTMPKHRALLERYTKISVDSIRTEQNGHIFVVFVLTSSGLLKKFGILPSKDKFAFCLIEVVQVFEPWNIPFISNDFQISDNQLFIATNRSLIRISVERCANFASKQLCLNANDPYCGWNSLSKSCSILPKSRLNRRYWRQKLVDCPPSRTTIKNWASWHDCRQLNRRNDELCKCRRRRCSETEMNSSSHYCMQVTNCTVDGHWSNWSHWSSCSSTCGNSSRIRTRHCSNPTPQFGGQLCHGPVEQWEMCHQKACRVDGFWTDWNSWTQCSKRCNEGVRTRTRQCVGDDGANCQGCTKDVHICNDRPCSETRRWSLWTPWSLQLNTNIENRGFTMQRFKFACGAQIDDPRSLSVSQANVQKKFCESNSPDCFRLLEIRGIWSDWTTWSICTKSCGSGLSRRTRICTSNGGACYGNSMETRQCNGHSCSASWSCWSDFNQCSVTCGEGVQNRIRYCNSLDNCKGKDTEMRSCNLGACSKDGYDNWSEWSVCNSELNVKVRLRKCIDESVCYGLSDSDLKSCFQNGDDVIYDHLLSASTKTSNLPVIFLSTIFAFIIGFVFASLSLVFLVKIRQKNGKTLTTNGGKCSRTASANANAYTAAPSTLNREKSRTPSRRSTSKRSSMAANSSDLALEGRTYAQFELAELDDSSRDRHNSSGSMRASLDTRDYL